MTIPFNQEINEIINKIEEHKRIWLILNLNDESSHDATINLCRKLQQAVAQYEPSPNYIEGFRNLITQIPVCYPLINQSVKSLNLENLNDHQKDVYKKNYSNNHDTTKRLEYNTSLEKQISIFEKIKFCSKNVVIVGGNGSGKTSLARELRKYMPFGVVIPAGKMLYFHENNNIPNAEQAHKLHIQKHQKNKLDRKAYGSHDIQDDFTKIIYRLIAEYIQKAISFYNQDIQKEETLLHQVIKIWNELTHPNRTLTIVGTTIKVKSKNNEYELNDLSQGEKVMLLYIAEVLLAEKNSFIVIDEPEMHLHKSIVKRLYDTLEELREDCLFVYITHDIDFAVDRKNAQKIWIKSFEHPDQWELEAIDDDQDLPMNLLLEILGSRKNILFCEGKANTKNLLTDCKIYKLLLPNFDIHPVGSCIEVKNYTRLYNATKNKYHNTNTAYGIVDKDFSSSEQEISKNNDNVYTLKTAELENLFLDKDFLTKFGTSQNISNLSSTIETITQQIIKKITDSQDEQIVGFVKKKYEFYLESEKLGQLKSKDNLIKAINDYTKKFNTEQHWNDQKDKLDENINNYSELIKIVNEKKLANYVSKNFGFDNKNENKIFYERALNFLNDNTDAKDILQKYLPKELLELSNKE